MLRKIFSALCMAAVILFAAQTQAHAAKIVMIFDAPTGTFSEPEKVYRLVQDTLGNILADSATDYEILSPADTENYVQIYREENDLITSIGAEEGERVEAYFKMEDIDNICTHFGGDYLIYTRVTNTVPKVSVGIFSASQITNVVTDFRVWSNSKKDFAYMKRVTATGKSTAIYAGIGSSSRALDKGLKKGLLEIELDADKIKAALSE